MYFRIYTIATAISLAMWVASFHAAQASYHIAQTTGILPNLHIRETLASLFS